MYHSKAYELKILSKLGLMELMEMVL